MFTTLPPITPSTAWYMFQNKTKILKNKESKNRTKFGSFHFQWCKNSNPGLDIYEERYKLYCLAAAGDLEQKLDPSRKTFQ